MPHIRPFLTDDWLQLWPILQQTFATGETYAFAPDSSEADIHEAWIDKPTRTYVICNETQDILGSYYIKPNQPGLGDHVCNCGYVVTPTAQGRGLASAMCTHSQSTAKSMGFKAMQFNLVVSTNTRAVRLWEHHGFSVVGRLPGAFRHARLGCVEALVMFKTLESA